METESIKQIQELKNKVALSVENYTKQLKKDKIDTTQQIYGPEKEYNIKGVIAGIKNILTDINFLCKSHNLFLKLSTYRERETIIAALQNLDDYIGNEYIDDIINQLCDLKVTLRPYNLRLDKDRFFEFSNEIDHLRKIASDFQEEINMFKQKSVELKGIESSITESDVQIGKIKNDFQDRFDSFQEKLEQLEASIETADSDKDSIHSILEDAREDKDEFDIFMKKIDEREEQLKKQMKNTEQFNETLSEYEIKQGNLMNIAENLIKSARTALNYKTAESISAAFNTQYTEAKENSHYQYWLWGAMGFVFLTLFIGIWILTGWFIHNDIDPLFSIIGRISMIPFTILGAIFCANQYIKQKNLIEDYAYKCVLAKSMIAFSEELRGKDSEKYSEYLSTVLKEIHQDPLRKRGQDEKINTNIPENLLQQVIELVKLAKQ